MADTPLGGSQVSETASEPGIKSPEHSMSPEGVTDTTSTTQPKSQPPKRRGKGKAYTQCILGKHQLKLRVDSCLNHELGLGTWAAFAQLVTLEPMLGFVSICFYICQVK